MKLFAAEATRRIRLNIHLLPWAFVSPPLTGEPQAPISQLPPDREIGSLWRRIVAFAIDSIIVGIDGESDRFAVLRHVFANWVPGGRLVGFCLALPYFVVLNSRIGDGQTLGKRVMHLQVVDKSGEPISLAKSFVRYLTAQFDVLPQTISGFRSHGRLSVITYLLGFTVFGARGDYDLPRIVQPQNDDKASMNLAARELRCGCRQIQGLWRYSRFGKGIGPCSPHSLQ